MAPNIGFGNLKYFNRQESATNQLLKEGKKLSLQHQSLISHDDIL